MNQPTIKIEELRLRVPGMNPREARQFGEQVARQLAGQLPASVRSRQIGSMNVRVNLPTGTSRANLPASIARNIARRMA
jgi:hypothetical protein